MRTRFDPRGFTLTELTIVMVLAAIAMTGLVAFYLNAQGVWMDASSQAVTQREGTLVLDGISQRASMATRATVTGPIGERALKLQFNSTFPDSVYYFWWQDSLIYDGPELSTTSRGAMLASRVERFEVTANDTFVRVRELRLRTPNGERIPMSTWVELKNRAGL
ncbi:MAG: prepilin-type N-terminal cleavage/methylation domain-containing protein [Candidatus Eisenbacteria bacterium]